EALLTCGVLVPQTFQLDARTLRLQPAVDAAGGFGLELAFQLPHSLLLRTEGLLGLGTGAVRPVELTLQVPPAICAVIAVGPHPLELGACLLELLRPRLGFESMRPRLLLEPTKLIVTLRDRAHVLLQRALDRSQLVLVVVLLSVKEPDVRLGLFLLLKLLPLQRSFGGLRRGPLLPPDELRPRAGAVALPRLEPEPALLRERILNREPGRVPARDQDVPEPLSGLLLDLECLLELLLRDDAHLDQKQAQQAPGLFQRTHCHLEESTDEASCMS